MLHREVGGRPGAPDEVDGDDVGRGELRLRARLAEEAVERERVVTARDDHLDGHAAIERAVVREVDDAHTATADLALDVK